MNRAASRPRLRSPPPLSPSPAACGCLSLTRCGTTRSSRSGPPGSRLPSSFASCARTPARRSSTSSRSRSSGSRSRWPFRIERGGFCPSSLSRRSSPAPVRFLRVEPAGVFSGSRPPLRSSFSTRRRRGPMHSSRSSASSSFSSSSGTPRAGADSSVSPWRARGTGGAPLAGLFAVRPVDAAGRVGLATVLLTLAGILLVSLWRPVAFPGRSEMAVVPIWIWVAARGGDRSRALRLSAGAAAGIGAIACLLISTAPRPSRPAEAALPALEAAARPGDLVVATVSFYLPARLARDRGHLAGELHAFPTDLEDHPGWLLPKAPSDADYGRLGRDIARASPASSVLLLFDRPYWDRRVHQMLVERGPVRPVAASPDWVLIAAPPR